MTKVYLDQDGVLADFDGGLLKSYGVQNCKTNYSTPWLEKTQAQKDVANAVVRCMEIPGFFQNLPMMEGADRLWKIAKKPYVLTAVPNLTCDLRVAKEKQTWIEQNFGQLPHGRFIACQRSEKASYAEGNILVDDAVVNCQEWEKAGGVAILFENMNQAIKDLKKAMNAR